MPISIVNIQRPNNCGHANVTINVDGVERTVHVHVDEVQEKLEALQMDYRLVLALAAIKYRRSRGDSWASIIGSVVVP